MNVCRYKKMKIDIIGKNKRRVKVIKEKTDPLYLLASLGGTPEKGYYCCVRGDSWDEIQTMLEESLETFKKAIYFK